MTFDAMMSGTGINILVISILLMTAMLIGIVAMGRLLDAAENHHGKKSYHGKKNYSAKESCPTCLSRVAIPEQEAD